MVQLSVTEEETGRVVQLEVSDDTTVEILRVLIEVDLNVKPEDQKLLFEGKMLGDPSKTIAELGVGENSMIVVSHLSSSSQISSNRNDNTGQRSSSTQFTNAPGGWGGGSGATSASSTGRNEELARQLASMLQSALRPAGGGAAPAVNSGTAIGGGGRRPSETPAETTEEQMKNQADELMALCREDPGTLGILSFQNPPLGNALRDAIKGTGKVDEVIAVLKEQHEKRVLAEKERQDKIAAALADPLSIEAQNFLEEQIHQQHVDHNFQLAQEHLPEAFGTVFMLYLDIEVNGVPIKAFVDSGAQSTIMSGKCAERCNLMRLVDKRFQGIAQGIGTSKIIGRIHMAQLKMGNQFFPASFTVLEDDKVDFLFGLDMLKRYQCCIDLRDNVLRIGNESIPFLSEKDLSNTLLGRLSSGSFRGDSIHSPALTARSTIGKENNSSGGSDSTTESQSSSTSSEASSSVSPDASSSVSQDNPSAFNASQSTTDAPPPFDSSVDTSEQKIIQLIELGFDRDQAIRALEQTGGNPVMAASLLFQQ